MSRYEIFIKCFPKLDISKEIFYKLANIQQMKCIIHKEQGELVGYALVEKTALRLLCVLPEYQGRGIGTTLLEQAENYIRMQGGKEILTGGVSSKLFIGAPEKAIDFFKKHGFEVIGSCDEMKRTMRDFQIDDFLLPVSEKVSFGWYDGNIEELRKAVADVEEDWTQYFNEYSRVFCGWYNDEVSSFCIVNYEAECILSNGSNKVGTIGCVGTVHKYRNQGIGLKMVALASAELKRENCDLCFIHFTGVANWYAKLGYETFLKEYFGKKELG